MSVKKIKKPKKRALFKNCKFTKKYKNFEKLSKKTKM